MKDDPNKEADALIIAEFPEQSTVYAEHQPEYLPLPAYRYGDPRGTIICCWKATWRQRLKFLFTGLIWHEILTFNHKLQPQLLMLKKPVMPTVKVVEIFPPESTEALKQTGLDIQVAGSVAGEANFFAAHGEMESYVVLDDRRFHDRALTVWELRGGTKAERKDRTQHIRDKYGGITK